MLQCHFSFSVEEHLTKIFAVFLPYRWFSSMAVLEKILHGLNAVVLRCSVCCGWWLVLICCERKILAGVDLV